LIILHLHCSELLSPTWGLCPDPVRSKRAWEAPGWIRGPMTSRETVRLALAVRNVLLLIENTETAVNVSRRSVSPDYINFVDRIVRMM